MPSISTKGSPSMIMRSAKVPLSPSSALQTMYFCVGRRVGARCFHLMPVGKPAPPRPRRPESRHLLDDRGAAPSPARASQARDSRHARGSRRASSGSMTPQRAKVRRCLALRGRGSPRSARGASACAPPSRKPASNSAGDVLGRDRPVGDAALPASRPRPAAPARTGRASRCGRSRRRAPRARGLGARCAAATSSAPTASAPASRGNEDAHAHRRDLVEQRVEPRRRRAAPTSRPSSIADGRGGAEAEAVDRLERDAAVGAWSSPRSMPSRARRVRDQRVAAHRLAGLGAAELAARAARPARGGSRGRR